MLCAKYVVVFKVVKGNRQICEFVNNHNSTFRLEPKQNCSSEICESFTILIFGLNLLFKMIGSNSFEFVN